MPLNKATLKASIETELTAGGFELTDFTKALATAVANAVVDEITTNAVCSKLTLHYAFICKIRWRD